MVCLENVKGSGGGVGGADHAATGVKPVRVLSGHIQRDRTARHQRRALAQAGHQRGPFGGAHINQGFGAQSLDQIDLAGDGPLPYGAQQHVFSTQANGTARSPCGGQLLHHGGQFFQRHHIHLRCADELRHKLVGRVVVQLQRCAHLFDLAIAQHHHAVGQGHGLDLVVRHIDGGCAQVAVQLGDLDPGLAPQGRIEVGQRLVKQEHFGRAHDGAANRHALALATRQFAWQAVQQVVDVQHLGGITYPFVNVGLVGTVDLEPERHVAVDRHVRVERIALEHHRDVAVLALQIIDDLDDRMKTIFEDAFNDTRKAFEQVFPVLFPGGSGSIFLTDPENLLTTGIEVNVKPAGKRIERLSLLSGGERSLAAVALLIAIFKARPSPFYVMDEVEAALDDANLGRLLQIFTDLRENSQLIIVTHQKRTMEIADALYGVSMRQDGVSAVVGQRLEKAS